MWASGLAGDLALSVLPRTAKLVVLHVISNKKENLRAEIDSADEGDGLQVEVIPFRQDDQPHPASKRNKNLRLSQSTNQYINHHSITIPPPSYNRTRDRRADGSTVTKPPRTISLVSLSVVPGPRNPRRRSRIPAGSRRPPSSRPTAASLRLSIPAETRRRMRRDAADFTNRLTARDGRT